MFFFQSSYCNFVLLLLFSGTPYNWFPYCINFYVWSAQEIFVAEHMFWFFKFTNFPLVFLVYDLKLVPRRAVISLLSIKCGQPHLIFPLSHVLQPYPCKQKKGLSSTFQPSEEIWSVQWPKRCDKHGNKDEDNSLKNVNSVHNTPSQKYRQVSLSPSWQRKEAEGTPQKQLPTPTTPMTERYWRIHTTKPKHYCIVWNEQPQALASMSIHTKLNICATTKQATFPH